MPIQARHVSSCLAVDVMCGHHDICKKALPIAEAAGHDGGEIARAVVLLSSCH
jgi:hypothetical protein